MSPTKLISVSTLLCLLLLCPLALFAADKVPEMSDADFKQGVAFIARMSAIQPFLKDSSDVLLEPKSLNQFFTDKIYQRLEGNAYFGYRYNEGFTACNKSEVAISEIKDLTGATGEAYRFALEQSLEAAGYKLNPKAACQIGIGIVGRETEETQGTLPGVMVEAYLRNASTKKSHFIRFGSGSPRGIAAAIRLSAAVIVSELEAVSER